MITQFGLVQSITHNKFINGRDLGIKGSFTDRIKHIITSGGENISPKEVEAVINRIGGVAESSVIGVPDEKWGEKIVAAVVKKPGSDVRTDDIQSMCKKHLYDWKCPKEVNLVKELPRNTMGKVLKEGVKWLF